MSLLGYYGHELVCDFHSWSFFQIPCGVFVVAREETLARGIYVTLGLLSHFLEKSKGLGAVSREKIRPCAIPPAPSTLPFAVKVETIATVNFSLPTPQKVSHLHHLLKTPQQHLELTNAVNVSLSVMSPCN